MLSEFLKNGAAWFAGALISVGVSIKFILDLLGGN